MPNNFSRMMSKSNSNYQSFRCKYNEGSIFIHIKIFTTHLTFYKTSLISLQHYRDDTMGSERQCTGGGFFHSKGTWGCAAREGILFRTSSLAKGVLFGNFSPVRSRQGYAFWELWSKRCQNSVTFVKKPNFLKILV